MPIPHLALLALSCLSSFAGQDAVPEQSRYLVSWADSAPEWLAVEAELPIDGLELAMDRTRPAQVPELDANGWPALVQGLTALDGSGKALALQRSGDRGWRLAAPCQGRIVLRYEVDLGPLAALDWPAPREACWLEEGFLSLVGRALFVTTPAQGASAVRFDLPEGWRAVAPWRATASDRSAFTVDSPQALVENLLVLSRSAPEAVQAGGLRVLVVPTGRWSSAREPVRDVLRGVVPRLDACMGSTLQGDYVVALLPQPERGGEAYRASFAMNFDGEPAAANRSDWGNTIAHEVFHLWNGWELHGEDYAGSQWFQEGFTEYAANVAMVSAGLVTTDEFLGVLAGHMRRREALTTSLEDTGGRKGPPLYSAGALVAFDWDVRIRHATDGRGDVWTVLRTLWQDTGQGARPYAWDDLAAALARTADLDWEGYRAAHIAGRDPAPLDEAFGLAGIRRREGTGDAPALELDPHAASPARALLRSLTGI